MPPPRDARPGLGRAGPRMPAMAWPCLLLLLLNLFAGWARAGSYEAKLPDGLFNDPDMCRHVACGSVLPQATRFGLREGNPAFVRGYRGQGDQQQQNAVIHPRPIQLLHFAPSRIIPAGAPAPPPVRQFR